MKEKGPNENNPGLTLRLLLVALIFIPINTYFLRYLFPLIGCVATQGYGQFYNREWVKGLIFLAWAALSILGFGLVGASDRVLGSVILGLLVVSRLVCSIVAARDAYRNEQA